MSRARRDGRHVETACRKIPGLPAGLSPNHATAWLVAKRPVLRAIALTLTAVLTFSVSLASMVAMDVAGRISGSAVSANVDKTLASKGKSWTPSDPWAGKPLDVLVLGQDTRAGEANAAIGGSDPSDADNHQADTAMIVHLSADRGTVTVVSLPRDSIVDQPACTVTGDKMAAARDGVMLNSTFAYGWQQGGDLASAVSCELATVDSETGLDIEQYAVVDFAGMKNVIDSLSGVELCVPAAVDDSYTGLKLSPGLQRLDGTQATQYARVRHGIEGADGGDIMRSARQQAVVKALVDEATSAVREANPMKLYQMASSMLESVKMSPALASPSTLVGLAWSLRGISADKIQSTTVPTIPWSQDANRVTWGDGASDLWTKLAADEPLTSMSADEGDDLPDNSGQSGEAASSTEASGPTATGDSAATTQATVDPATGLMTIDGELVDPVTGGVVDPETGYITDQETGSVVGLASKYLSTTVCKPAD